MWVRKLGDGLGLAFQTLPPCVRGRHIVRQDLDRDFPTEAGVAGSIDLTHAA